MCHSGGNRDYLSNDGKKSAKKSIKICIFIKKLLGPNIVLVFDSKIFPVFFYKCISNKRPDEVIDSCTNPYSTKSDHKTNNRVHCTSRTLHTNSDHWNLWREWNKRRFYCHHNKDSCVVDLCEKIKNNLIKGLHSYSRNIRAILRGVSWHHFRYFSPWGIRMNISTNPQPRRNPTNISPG